jgi:cation transporter-like permease
MSRQVPAAPEPQIKPVAVVQLIAIVTLALSTLIAATAVSIGHARAEFAPISGTPPCAATLQRVAGAV